MPKGVYDHWKRRGQKFPEKLYSNYGMRNKKQSEEFKMKMTGNNNPAKRPEVREKIRKSKMGDKNPMKNTKFAKKMSETKKWLFKEGKIKPTIPKGSKRPEICGDKHHMHRPEVKVKFIGDKNPNWRGGIARLPYPYEFRVLRNQIRERDNYTCQFPKCRIPEDGRMHDVHHIDYDKKNYSPKNLISLCKRHNAKVNFNREYWTQYFQKLQKRTHGHGCRPQGGL